MTSIVSLDFIASLIVSFEIPHKGLIEDTKIVFFHTSSKIENESITRVSWSVKVRIDAIHSATSVHISFIDAIKCGGLEKDTLISFRPA